ncbi:hypothetical protein HDU97_005048 [Phlyctochytrium planicorne]|nr:hypothetical protein HDU97_005048 [Phlyctochytrium planicorne]
MPAKRKQEDSIAWTRSLRRGTAGSNNNKNNNNNGGGSAAGGNATQASTAVQGSSRGRSGRAVRGAGRGGQRLRGRRPNNHHSEDDEESSMDDISTSESESDREEVQPAPNDDREGFIPLLPAANLPHDRRLNPTEALSCTKTSATLPMTFQCISGEFLWGHIQNFANALGRPPSRAVTFHSLAAIGEWKADYYYKEGAVAGVVYWHAASATGKAIVREIVQNETDQRRSNRILSTGRYCWIDDNAKDFGKQLIDFANVNGPARNPRRRRRNSDDDDDEENQEEDEMNSAWSEFSSRFMVMDPWFFDPWIQQLAKSRKRPPQNLTSRDSNISFECRPSNAANPIRLPAQAQNQAGRIIYAGSPAFEVDDYEWGFLVFDDQDRVIGILDDNYTCFEEGPGFTVGNDPELIV